ncbi:hypothetical protein COV24_04105 [candidate division WWE3 bacterium CG10_big_fil_rev_8_21_14_0_10_32_10]|uniref:peptidylprolyl isomerase n=1 Tax=candidate division WWE3 bacterium CG10_big_fil_rev_8_21_14_0_10_32_10 TaxID=1975090 RepID=A0A2H0R9J3_UNCKA|nr:MAG: hypothetical protein COV24_04105 [candidate division WWE3 bacterium CG10_big_fil_rev_8_21_14_0_10_32_10]
MENKNKKTHNKKVKSLEENLKTKKTSSKKTNKSVASKVVKDEVKKITRKPKISKKFVANLVLVVAIVGLIALFVYNKKELFVAATVNGKPITRLDLIKELEKQGGKQTLDTMVTKSLLRQEAVKKGIVVSKEDLDKEKDSLKKNIESSGQTWEQFLQYQNLTEEQLNEELSLRVMLNKLLAEKVNVTEDEITTYLEQNSQEGQDNTNKDLRDQTKEQLKNQKMSSESQTFLENLKKGARVQYFLTF